MVFKTVKTRVSAFIRSICLLLSLLISTSAYSINIDPSILEKFNFVQENGETVVEVSMESLLLLTLERSTIIDILSINQKIAEDNLKATKEIYNPVLTTSAGLSHSVDISGTNLSGNIPKISYTATAFSFSQSPYLSFSASDVTTFSVLWNKMDTRGILYSVNYNKITSRTGLASIQNDGDSPSDWVNFDDPLYLDQLVASLKIPIFKDWGDINKHPEYKGMIGVEQTKTISEKTKLDLLNMIANIYWNLIGVQQNIKAINSTIHLSEQFLEDTKTRYKLGIIDSIEVKQSETQLALNRQHLLQEKAKKSLIEDQIRAALNLSDLPYGYKATEKLFVRDDIPDFNSLLKRVFGQNKDLELLDISIKMNQLSLTEAHNQNDTDLDLSFQYQMNGYGNDYSKAATGISETKLHDYAIGVSWKIPLFDKVSPQKIQQTLLEKSRIDLQIENQKSQLKVELQSILRNLKLTKESIELAQTSANLVQDLLHKETEKFKVGNNTSFRVAQIQQDLTNARKNEILARVQYEKSYLALLVITEDIFKYYHLPSNN